MGSMVPGSPNFFQRMMEAWTAGQQVKRQREAEMAQQEERKLRLETLKFEQNRIKLEDKIRAATMNREGAIGNLRFMEGINPPQEALPEGIPGPPRPTGPESMQIPGITVPEAGINVPGMTAPVRYAPDMQRLLEDAARRQAEMDSQRAGMTAQATAEGQAAVAQRPRPLPGTDQMVPGDMLDNIFSALTQRDQQTRQQTFTAGESEKGRKHDYALEGTRQAGARTLERERRAANQAEEASKPLSGEAAKVLAVANTMIPEAEQLKEAFRKNYTGAVRGIVSGTDRRLSKLAEQVADKVGRLRSGGAINSDESGRFMGQIASLKDLAFGDPEAAIAAIDGVINEARQVSTSIRPRSGNLQAGQPAPRLSGAVPTATDASGRRVQWNGSAWVPAQ